MYFLYVYGRVITTGLVLPSCKSLLKSPFEPALRA